MRKPDEEASQQGEGGSVAAAKTSDKDKKKRQNKKKKNAYKQKKGEETIHISFLKELTGEEKLEGGQRFSLGLLLLYSTILMSQS